MKAKILTLGILMIFLAGCSVYRYSPNFAPQNVIQKVKAHRVAIAAYYEMSEDEYLQRLKQKHYLDMSLFVKEDGQSPDKAIKAFPYYLGDNPILIKKDEQTQNVVVAYLGAGIILKDNYILTVNHLFDREHQNNTTAMHIWVLQEGIDHPIQASLVVRTQCEVSQIFSDDYAIIRMEENLGLPGLKIAKPNKLKDGDKVIFTGSTGGLAFFSRFSSITKLQHFFQKDTEGRLHLSFWEDFPFWTVYPGGPGDSGGPVVNFKGEIVTVMYCGITVYSEDYIFGNPTQMIWDFLKKYNLEYLGK